MQCTSCCITKLSNLKLENLALAMVALLLMNFSYLWSNFGYHDKTWAEFSTL
jgi:hypothetical protein